VKTKMPSDVLVSPSPGDGIWMIKSRWTSVRYHDPAGRDIGHALPAATHFSAALGSAKMVFVGVQVGAAFDRQLKLLLWHCFAPLSVTWIVKPNGEPVVVVRGSAEGLHRSASGRAGNVPLDLWRNV